ncbi:MAG: cyanase, partial [Paraglaciecola chathamensis]
MQNREQVTQAILLAKVQKGITWQQVAEQVGQSKEWTTAGCLGQMTFNAEQAAVVAKIFDLDENAEAWLQVVPYK